MSGVSLPGLLTGRTSWLPLTQSTLKLTLPLVVLGVVMTLTSADFASAYWLDLSSKATIALLLLAPSYAALCAWDAGSWKALNTAAARGPVRQLAVTLLPAVVGTAVTYGVSLLLLATTYQPTAGSPDLALLTTSLVVMAGYCCLGFVIGWFVPRFVAAAAAFALVWLWVAFPPTFEPFWVRNVTGNFGTSCCTVDQELVAGSLVAPLLVAVALIASAVLAITSVNPARTASLLGVPLIIAAVASAGWLMRDVGPDPVQARSGQQVCSTGRSVQFCAWPEHADKLERATGPLEETVVRLREAGMGIPDTLRENTPDQETHWSFSLAGGMDEDWTGSLALSPLGNLPPVCAQDQGWPAGDYWDSTARWLLDASGVDARWADDGAAGRGPKHLQDLEDLPAGEQASRVSEILEAMHTCGTVTP
ncbi:hypothetical protein GCM10027591_09930 [Zhihengliuella somnathii]